MISIRCRATPEPYHPNPTLAHPNPPRMIILYGRYNSMLCYSMSYHVMLSYYIVNNNDDNNDNNTRPWPTLPHPTLHPVLTLRNSFF